MKQMVLAAWLALAGFGSAVQAASVSPEQKAEFEQIIRDYLLQHPEILEDMTKVLELRQKTAQDEARKATLAQSAKDIFRQPADLVMGNEKGSVTMVEFFDYNCGWCKKGLPEVMALLDSDKDLRLVLKEFPIFGEDSEYAARAVIASAKQGKALDLHLALMRFEGKVNKDVVDEAAKAHGLDLAKLSQDMASPDTDAVLTRNHQLGQSLAINGTPAFLIADRLVPGFLPHSELAAAVAQARKAGSCAKLC